MNSPIQAVLIVEGADESDVIGHLQDLYGITGVHVVQLSGRADLMNKVKMVAFDSTLRDVQKVGIVFDSEDDPKAAKEALQEASNYLSQLQPHPKIVRVLQLPDESQVGSFEALCLQAIDAEDDVFQCCNQFLACLEGKKHKLTTQARKDKARLLAWYAAKNGKHISRIGRDAYQGDRVFNYEHAAFRPLVTFLQSLVV